MQRTIFALQLRDGGRAFSRSNLHRQGTYKMFEPNKMFYRRAPWAPLEASSWPRYRRSSCSCEERKMLLARKPGVLYTIWDYRMRHPDCYCMHLYSIWRGDLLGGGHVADDALANDLHQLLVRGGGRGDEHRLRREHLRDHLQPGRLGSERGQGGIGQWWHDMAWNYTAGYDVGMESREEGERKGGRVTFMVVPVSTRSTTASASPSPHAASTDPDTYFISAATTDKWCHERTKGTQQQQQ